MNLQGGGLNFLQGGNPISLQNGSSPAVQGGSSAGTLAQNPVSGIALNNPNTTITQPATTPNQQTNNLPPAPSITPAAPVYQDKTNSIAADNAGLNSAATSRDTMLSSIQKALSAMLGTYDSEKAAADQSYQNESTANEQDLQGNKESALQAARQGRQGLFGTLASLGALSGTGIDLANHAVQQGANQDLTTAADTYATNQNGLDSTYGTWNRNDQERRNQANTNAANDKQIAENDYYKNEQSYLTNLANDYSAEGNAAQAKNYTDQLVAVAPLAAATNTPQIDIGYSGGAYTAPTLNSYLGRANNTTVQSTPGATPSGSVFNIPGLVAAQKRQVA